MLKRLHYLRRNRVVLYRALGLSDAEIATLGDDELAQLEYPIELPDPDLYAALTGDKALAPEYDSARKWVTVVLAAFCWFAFLAGHIVNNVRGFGS